MPAISSQASRSLFLVLFAAMATALWTLTPLRDYATIAGVQSLVQNQRDTWPLFFVFLGLYAIGNFFFLPIPLITFAASLIFPVWKVIICGLIGVAFASSLGYAAGCFVEIRHWPESFRKFGVYIAERLSGQAFWAIVLLRVAPTPPFTVTSMVAGSCRFDRFSFLLGSLLGVIPSLTLVSLLGDRILIFLQKPTTLSILLLAAALALLLILHYASKRERPAMRSK